MTIVFTGETEDELLEEEELNCLMTEEEYKLGLSGRREKSGGGGSQAKGPQVHFGGGIWSMVG